SAMRALERLVPDVLLVEGPPDAQALIPLAIVPEMKPPVALVVYPPDRPGLGVFYPFAAFSPEWNVIRYALERGIPVRFCDMRQARGDGFSRIAVVCGAWHGPALETLPPRKKDDALLRGLKRVKVDATWVPWTASRLTYVSGYGAGVESPAWYRHLWETNGDLTAWLVAAARLLRSEDLDASPAQVVDAVRLAEALAALRDRPQPSLSEVTEATLSVLRNG